MFLLQVGGAKTQREEARGRTGAGHTAFFAALQEKLNVPTAVILEICSFNAKLLMPGFLKHTLCQSLTTGLKPTCLLCKYFKLRGHLLDPLSKVIQLQNVFFLFTRRRCLMMSAGDGAVVVLRSFVLHE